MTDVLGRWADHLSAQEAAAPLLAIKVTGTSVAAHHPAAPLVGEGHAAGREGYAAAQQLGVAGGGDMICGSLNTTASGLDADALEYRGATVVCRQSDLHRRVHTEHRSSSASPAMNIGARPIRPVRRSTTGAPVVSNGAS